MATHRLVLVDDTDAAIQYHGPWFADRGSRDKIGNFGAPFNNTLHGTRVTSSISFSYTGGGFIVFGSNNPREDNGVIDPQWECFLDDVRVPPTAHFGPGENNWHMCELLTAADGPHTLHVNVTVQREQVFWFDSIQYAPSASVDLTNKDLLIDAKDDVLQAAMLASRAWQPWGPAVNFTTVPGTSFKFDFVGTGLQWYGSIPEEQPRSPSTGTYTIDGGKPTPFTLNGLPGPGPHITLFCQLFFETPRLPYDSHTINVVYNGPRTPLTLDYLVAFGKNSNSPSAPLSIDPGSSRPGTNPTGNGALSGTPKDSLNIAAIAGGAAGGVVLLLLIILGIWCLRRRKRARSTTYPQAPPTYTDIPNATAIVPFPISQTVSRNQSSDFQRGHTPQIPSSSDMYASMAAPPTGQMYSPVPTGPPNPYPAYSTSSGSQAGTDFSRSDAMSRSTSPPTSRAYSINTEGPTSGSPPATPGMPGMGATGRPSKRAMPPPLPPQRAVPKAPMPPGRRSQEKLERERAREAAAQLARKPPPVPPKHTHGRPSLNHHRRRPSHEREVDGSQTVQVAVPFRHVDSGVRILEPPPRRLPPLEIPPMYTAH